MVDPTARKALKRRERPHAVGRLGGVLAGPDLTRW